MLHDSKLQVLFLPKSNPGGMFPSRALVMHVHLKEASKHAVQRKPELGVS
jgi:hypothetical protein